MSWAICPGKLIGEFVAEDVRVFSNEIVMEFSGFGGFNNRFQVLDVVYRRIGFEVGIVIRDFANLVRFVVEVEFSVDFSR